MNYVQFMIFVVLSQDASYYKFRRGKYAIQRRRIYHRQPTIR